MHTNMISIPHSYFRQHTKTEYNDWKFALTREFVQNSRDCGSTHVQIYIDVAMNTREFVCANNGAPMSREVLLKVLLSLGGSAKSEGSVGGFGQAKNLLYFSWKRWSIHTGNLLVEGSGPMYSDPVETDFINGTVSRIYFEDSVDPISVYWAAEEYLKNCVLGNCHVSLNGKQIKNELRRGKRIDQLSNNGVPFADVYLNKQRKSKQAKVYVGGLYMFSAGWITQDCGSVSIELLGDTIEILTANRDGLRYPYGTILQQYMEKVAKDANRALHRPEREFSLCKGNGEVWAGGKRDEFGLCQNDKEKMIELCKDETTTIDQLWDSIRELKDIGAISEVEAQNCYRMNVEEAKSELTKVLERLGAIATHDYAVERHLPCPLSLSQIQAFLGTKKAKVLMKQWTEIVKLALECAGHDIRFTPGFVWSEKASAEFAPRDNKIFFLINPHCAEMKEKMTPFERLDQVMQSACHEVNHVNYSYHDEAFISGYHDLWTKMIKRYKEFAAFRHDRIKIEK